MIAAETPDLCVKEPVYLTITDHDEDGPLLGCLECGETTRAQWGFTRVYLKYELCCGDCGALFLHLDDLRPLRQQRKGEPCLQP